MRRSDDAGAPARPRAGRRRPAGPDAATVLVAHGLALLGAAVLVAGLTALAVAAVRWFAG
jgi:hypothetical protein